MRKIYHFDPLRITHYSLDADHCIKKRLRNQQSRDNIGNKPMNRRTYLLLLLIIVCLSIPSGAAAQYTISIISGNGQTGHPGQALKPFVVEVRQNGSPVRVFVTFLPSSSDSVSLTNTFVQTGPDGRAQSTVTPRGGAGTITITVRVNSGNQPSVTFTATITIPPPPEPPKLPRLFIISGGNQTGIIGETLANPFAIRVRDPDNNPLEGVPVTFTVTAGGGTLSTTATVTDAKGRAESTLALGSEPGTNTVEVRARDISQTRVFSAEATLPPSEPTTLSIVSGDNQTGVIGEVLASPFVVEVRDQYDDPLEGATVTFAVTASGGTLSVVTVMTDANGQAESILTLGADPGTNTVEATVAGISQTETFSAEATRPPPTPTTLSGISDGEQDELTGGTSMDSSVVEVIDQDGNPLGDVPVTFTILEPDGSMSTTTGTTDENGRAAFTLLPNSDPGTYTITASVEGIAETVTFTVVVPLEFDLTLPAGLNLIHIPLKVRAVDEMSAQIESVSDLYDALGGTATVNWLITHAPQTQTWYSYFGDADRDSIANRMLTEEAGILASIKTPISVRLDGDALGADGTSAITLNRGLNLVGLPLQDSRIMRVSDLFALEGIGGVITIIVVTDNGEFKAVGRPEDPGDIPITGGQGFILIVQQSTTIPITGTGWDNVP